MLAASTALTNFSTMLPVRTAARLPRMSVRTANSVYMARAYGTSVKEVNAAQGSYRPKGYGMSEGFLRARKPYVVKNILLSSAIMAFIVSVFTYTIFKVRTLLTRSIRMTSLTLRVCVSNRLS